MCIVKVKPEEEVVIANRIVTSRQNHSHGRSSHEQLSADHRRRSSPRSTLTTTIIEDRRPAVQYIEASSPPPPPPPVPFPISAPPQAVAHATVIEQISYSPRSSAVSVQSREREYLRERRRSRSRDRYDTQQPGYRYVDASPTRHGDRVSYREYMEDPRRRSGSITYAINPRNSAVSHRSRSERVVVVDDYGRRREYFR
ncbi:MAG: hypothetical protein M1829_005982 [Trizodia sp. TS-e1964]|nr:MAG: hypothetical protein M1829_005982 [Trizodia sp. TS-e1964]